MLHSKSTKPKQQVGSQTGPESRKWLVDGFCWYSKGLVSKRFASFGVSGMEKMLSVAPDENVVVYLNHVGWWDPIIGMLIRQHGMPDRTLYAPIDAEQLERYAILKKMGFFGVTSGSQAGAADFLNACRRILTSPRTSLWITPEGKFCDARDYSAPLMPGLAHIATKFPQVVFLPIAVEYVFWADALPHVFCHIGSPLRWGANSSSGDLDEATRRGDEKTQANAWLTSSLRRTQQELAELVIRRDPAPFQYIVENRAKRLSWYDFFRKCSATIRGKPFDPRHSAGMSNVDLRDANQNR